MCFIVGVIDSVATNVADKQDGLEPQNLDTAN